MKSSITCRSLAGGLIKAPIIIIFSASISLIGAAADDDQSRPDQKSASSAEATLKSLDRNHDRAPSKIEAKANSTIAADFATADVNLDGYISKPEYVAFVQRSTAPPATREPTNE